MVQLEFHAFRSMFAGGVLLRRRVRAKTSAIDYTLRLSAALRVYALTHQLHDVLCAVLKLEARDGHATIPGITLELACSYMNVSLHLLRNPGLFIEDATVKPRRVRLSPEAIELLGKIKRRIART